MMRTPDGHGRLELTKFRHPKLVEIEPAIAPPNTLGLRSVMFAVERVDDTVACAPSAANSSARWPSTRTSTDSATCEALRASSSRWLRNSSEAFAAVRDPGDGFGRAGICQFPWFRRDGNSYKPVPSLASVGPPIKNDP